MSSGTPSVTRTRARPPGLGKSCRHARHVLVFSHRGRETNVEQGLGPLATSRPQSQSAVDRARRGRAGQHQSDRPAGCAHGRVTRGRQRRSTAREEPEHPVAGGPGAAARPTGLRPGTVEALAPFGQRVRKMACACEDEAVGKPNAHASQIVPAGRFRSHAYAGRSPTPARPRLAARLTMRPPLVAPHRPPAPAASGLPPAEYRSHTGPGGSGVQASAVAARVRASNAVATGWSARPHGPAGRFGDARRRVL